MAAAAKAAERATDALANRKKSKITEVSDDKLESAKKRKVDTEDKDEGESGEEGRGRGRGRGRES